MLVLTSRYLEETGGLRLLRLSLNVKSLGQNTCESPNRKVGVLSLQPTKEFGCHARRAKEFPNPPTGRLGCFHFSLQRNAAATLGALKNSQIPQPEGWGNFHAGLRRNGSAHLAGFVLSRAGARVKHPQPPGWGIYENPAPAAV